MQFQHRSWRYANRQLLSAAAATALGAAATATVSSACASAAGWPSGCHGFFEALFLAFASSACRCFASASAVLSLTCEEATPLT